MSDGRECGWMGCHHPRCEKVCTAVPLDEWRAWKVKARSEEDQDLRG